MTLDDITFPINFLIINNLLRLLMLKYFGSGPQVKGYFQPCTKSIGKLIYLIIVINLFDLKKIAVAILLKMACN
jgi:hypothetical protein